MSTGRVRRIGGGEKRRKAEAAEHLEAALARATLALDRLREAGIEARVVGSLARDRGFTRSSDVDFLVDAPYEREYEAFKIIESVMEDMPFDLLPRRRIRSDALGPIEKEACDAAALRARRPEAV